MKKIALILLTASTIFTSCKKEVTDTSSSPFNTISEKRWQLTSYLYNSIGVDVESITTLDVCVADDYWTLKTDFTNSIDENKIKCNGSQVRTQGTWELKNAAKELYIKNYEIAKLGVSEYTYTVVELSATKLILQRKDNGNIHTFIYNAK